MNALTVTQKEEIRNLRQRWVNGELTAPQFYDAVAALYGDDDTVAKFLQELDVEERVVEQLKNPDTMLTSELDEILKEYWIALPDDFDPRERARHLTQLIFEPESSKATFWDDLVSILPFLNTIFVVVAILLALLAIVTVVGVQ